VWSTLLSQRHSGNRGLAITGYEMLKGLEGSRLTRRRVDSHFQRFTRHSGLGTESFPSCCAARTKSTDSFKRPTGYILGETTWHSAPARRDFEFLFEVVGRRDLAEMRPPQPEGFEMATVHIRRRQVLNREGRICAYSRHHRNYLRTVDTAHEFPKARRRASARRLCLEIDRLKSEGGYVALT